jgi:hypothetical protein
MIVYKEKEIQTEININKNIRTNRLTDNAVGFDEFCSFFFVFQTDDRIAVQL